MMRSKFKALGVLVVIVLLTVTIIILREGKSSSGHSALQAKSAKLPIGAGVPAIGVGSAHGIILASDGSLWSWGEKAHGWPVLGQANVTNQPSLRQIGKETNWTSIAVGDHHNLAIKSDGSLWGWGENTYGELGNGAQGRTNPSTRVSSTPIRSAPGNDWKQVAVGGSHSLGLKKDGTLWAWGSNWAGQLGIGITDRIVPAPMQVGSGTNWLKVWAGLLETVALQADGSLWFWGDNPNPAIPQTGPLASNIFSPMLISPGTTWLDVGFGP